MLKAQKQFKKDRTLLKSCFLLVAIVLVVGIAAYIVTTSWYNDAIFQPYSSSTEEVLIEVPEGESLTNLAKTLEAKGLIKSELAVRVYLRLNNLLPNIRYGTYSIAKNQTVLQIIDTLEKGEFKAAIWVTIKEGLRYEQIADILDIRFAEGGSEVRFNKTLFLDIAEHPDNYIFDNKDVTQLLKTTKPAGNPLRGYLYPDTYRFDIDATSQQVVETLISNLNKKLKENNIDVSNVLNPNSQLKSFYQALILASILEKEANGSDDRELISGIFHNRLEDKYLLQADSTVNFITGKLDPGVLIEDTKIDSPYNTYKYTGLPPTPISNPGIATIKAALNPKKTKFYFFVHDSKGNVYYAETFLKHQDNINRYLK